VPLKPNKPIFKAIKAKINRDSLIIDSLVKVKQKVKIKYVTLYDSILIQAPDTCHTYLVTLNKECLKLDSSNASIITAQTTQINDYHQLTVMQQNLLFLDSLEIYDLNKKLKRTRKLAWLGTGLGFIGGIIIR
jgi:hypothetical protein